MTDKNDVDALIDEMTAELHYCHKLDLQLQIATTMHMKGVLFVPTIVRDQAHYDQLVAEAHAELERIFMERTGRKPGDVLQ